MLPPENEETVRLECEQSLQLKLMHPGSTVATPSFWSFNPPLVYTKHPFEHRRVPMAETESTNIP